MPRFPIAATGMLVDETATVSSGGGGGGGAGTPSFYINVKDAPYGAVGDGVTDDSAAFQAVFNYIKANYQGNGGPTVIVPQGTYKIGTTVSITQIYGLKLQGAGSLYSPLLTYTGAGSDAGVFKFIGCAVQMDGINFGYNNASFTGDNVKFATGSGINSPDKITNCNFVNGASGYPARSQLCLASNLNTIVSDGVIRSAQNGIILDNSAINVISQIQRCAFSNCVVSEIQIATPDTEAFTIDACTFEGLNTPAQASIYFSTGSFYGRGVVSNSWFGDDFSVGVPWIKGAGGNGGITLINNNFFSNSNRATQPQIQVAACALIGNYLECSVSVVTQTFGYPLADIGNRWNSPLAQQVVVNPASTGGYAAELPLRYSFGGDSPLVQLPGLGPGHGIQINASGGQLTKSQWVGGATRSGTSALGPYGAGTWVAGQWATDPEGRVIVCTVGGTPGTWIAVGARGTPALDLGSVTGTVTPDMNVGMTKTMVLGGNITLAAPTNPSPGDNLRLIFKQDATGGRTVTFNGLYTVYDFTPNTAANKTNIIEFECFNSSPVDWRQTTKLIQP